MTLPPIDPNKGSILIVDDTPFNLRLLSSMLVQHGYEVRSAISGSAALMAVESNLPDLILLDINMPRMNGYEVCSRLKAEIRTQEIPIIFLSALDETTDKVRAFQVGGVDYITKPFQVEEVLVRVETQLSQQRMKRELQQAKADALRALDREKELNRLKTEFVAMLTHDFRTPLTSIQGFAELLHYAEASLTADTKTRYFQKIDAAVEHMLQLLDEVLLIGGIEAGKLQCQPQSLDLKQFCQDVIDTIELSSALQSPICFKIQGDYNSAEIDPTLLQQILTNLLSNAIKYSPNGGNIYLTVECDNNLATFAVQDEGIGIPHESQAQLFETFYRGNNVGQIRGTGLGLAIVKQCVEAHQGQVELESAVGLGTTVRVILPLTPNSPNFSAPVPPSPLDESEK